MSKAKIVTFNLKAVINKEKTRVLFAEVDNDFMDLLFSFLILPLGKIMYVLDMHYGDKTPHVIGSLNTLYHGLSNLVLFQFQLYDIKPSILKPESAYFFPFLNKKVLGLQSNPNTLQYYLNEAYFLVHRIFTENRASFIIRDDLRIVANGNKSIVQTLNSVGVDMPDMDGAETRNVIFCFNEVMDFLKGLLISSHPLTDIILSGASVKSETAFSLHHIEEEATSNSTKMYDLKVMLQKSTKKLLFAQAEKDFVSLLSTMITIPLGLVDLHMGGNTCFKRIGSLYRSMIDLVDRKYFNGTDIEDRLIKSETFSYYHLEKIATNLLHVEGSRMYIVTNDLIVTRLCVSSTLSLLNQMKISSSDVEEVELHIGLKEAYNILKASLASTSALSDGLINPMLKKQRKVKQEH